MFVVSLVPVPGRKQLKEGRLYYSSRFKSTVFHHGEDAGVGFNATGALCYSLSGTVKLRERPRGTTINQSLLGGLWKTWGGGGRRGEGPVTLLVDSPAHARMSLRSCTMHAHRLCDHPAHGLCRT